MTRVRVGLMFQWQRLPGWLMLASYLLANTVSALWHDHPGCSDCSSSLPFEERQCERRSAAEHAHHDCDHRHTDHAADHDSTPVEPQHQGAAHHACAVCDFLALAPLPATPAVLIDAGVAPPAPFPCLAAQSARCLQREHPARGPPVAG